MHTKGLVFLGTTLLGAALAVACSDEDDPAGPGTNTGDGGTNTPVDSGGNTDAAKADTGTPDGGGTTYKAITTFKETRLENAINPYGLTFGQDGNIYVSGSTHQLPGPDQKLAVWRFKADGTLDTAFGTNGVVTVGLAGAETSFAIEEISAGNFVVHALAGGFVYLTKLSSSGGVFSFAQPVRIDFDWIPNDLNGWGNLVDDAGADAGPRPAPAHQSWGFAVDRSDASSPKIVVFANGPVKATGGATQRYDGDRWITRVDANTFAIDPTFNGGKPLSVDGDGKNRADNSRRGTVLADGTILSAGYTDYGAGLLNHIVLIRVKKDGTLDTTFGAGSTPGQTKINPFVSQNGGFTEAYNAVVGPTGNYITTGYGTTNVGTTTAGPDLITTAIKPNSDGLDLAYGTTGATVIQSETVNNSGADAAVSEDRGRDLVVLPDGRSIHAGAFGGKIAFFAVDKDGKPDTTFGTEGRLVYGTASNFFKIAVSADGKTIAATTRPVNEASDSGILANNTLPVSQLVILKVAP